VERPGGPDPLRSALPHLTHARGTGRSPGPRHKTWLPTPNEIRANQRVPRAGLELSKPPLLRRSRHSPTRLPLGPTRPGQADDGVPAQP
jgi:hypothetical protein